MTKSSRRSEFTHKAAKSVVNGEALRAHAEAAPAYLLLLSAVHATDDASLLDRYESRVGKPPSMGDSRVLTPAAEAETGVREELIQILEDALTREDQPEYLGVEDRALFERMQDIAVGFQVNREHTDMNLEQGGWVPDDRYVTPTKSAPEGFKVAIIGAGMTGIDAAVKATDRGIEWELFEKGSGVGGLWWSSRYPGVAVDTPSVFYSLSWNVTPDWSKHFPLGDEYRKYLTKIAEKFDLEKNISFGSEITRMVWLEKEQLWELTVKSVSDNSHRTMRFNAVIGGAGHLCRPNYPNVEGRDDFAGLSLHTATWNGDVSLKGKRVGVVGVGAAGVQVISSITPEVGHLTVFQRQPVWLSRNQLGDGLVSDSEHWLRRHLPYYLHWARTSLFATFNNMMKNNAVDLEWMEKNPDSISEANARARQACFDYIRDSFGDSELGKAVTPDFPFNAKRPVRDPGDDGPGGYYWSLKQDHVDLELSSIARVVPEGIVTADGTLHELDVLVWATGQLFDFMSPVEIIGRDGLTLREAWEDYLHPRTYFGGLIAGFPNFFMNDGPHTGVANGGAGHNFMTETVNHFIFESLQLLIEDEVSSMEVTQETYDAHTETLEELMSHMIWAHDTKANTYYRNARGYVVLPNPFEVGEYWRLSRKPERQDFILRSAATAEVAA